jgi:hypothetical protein
MIVQPMIEAEEVDRKTPIMLFENTEFLMLGLADPHHTPLDAYSITA